ncbi:hypothetical protein SAY86_009587 [Trapa natans]|uniref:Uncharacterized protein n=1 Tax=Trapa natans TaxID=22666 RepID=A0AAN7L536_TRANT|nr:hypothetical protein SAY86_009587 [Trapa natans]
MENRCTPPPSWGYTLCHGKKMDEVRNNLLYTVLELESTRLDAQEEMKKRDDQLVQLRELLIRVMKERDEANENCRGLIMERSFLLQHYQILNAPAEKAQPLPPRRGVDSMNNSFSSSDCEESIVSCIPFQLDDSTPLPVPQEKKLLLPEKGKLLQAVMDAGPLLQTLLLAGPLPKWRHPPPQLEPSEIPLFHAPLASSGRMSRHKRGILEGSAGSPRETKFQRVAPTQLNKLGSGRVF